MTPRATAMRGAGLSSSEPDPDGSRLALLRDYLATVEDAKECGLFMDHVCLPQKPRTAEEDEVFHRGLTKMGSLYASVTGTAVIQIKSIPDRPEDFEGRIIVHGLPAEVDEASLTSALRAYGSVVRCEVILAELRAEVQFATHAQAERALVRLGKGKALRRASWLGSAVGRLSPPSRCSSRLPPSQAGRDCRTRSPA